jgi:hypothetical protein
MFDWANMFAGGAKPGAGGWSTNITTGAGQKGLDALMNPLVKNTEGQVMGLSDPFMKTMGGAFQAAGGAMPGGTPYTPAERTPAGIGEAFFKASGFGPQTEENQGAFAPQMAAPTQTHSKTPQQDRPTQGTQTSWIQNLFR